MDPFANFGVLPVDSLVIGVPFAMSNRQVLECSFDFRAINQALRFSYAVTQSTLNKTPLYWRSWLILLTKLSVRIRHA